jgi:ABC-type glutathione transport system ATPase component
VSAPLLAVEQLCLDRGGARVLDRISFELGEAEILGLVGESGSGKSTLARAVAGLVPTASGRVLLRGRDLPAPGGRAQHAARRELQLVYQEPVNSLDPRLTVEECVAEPLVVHRLVPRQGRRARVLELLQRLELGAELLERLPHQLSGGQAQRVALARALAARPALLIADEMLSALDPSLTAQLVNLLRGLRAVERISCLFITHDLRIAAHLCDRIAVLSAGRLAEVTEPPRLLDDAREPPTRALVAAARGR